MIWLFTEWYWKNHIFPLVNNFGKKLKVGIARKIVLYTWYENNIVPMVQCYHGNVPLLPTLQRYKGTLFFHIMNQ